MGAGECGVAELEHSEMGVCTTGQPGLQCPSPREVKETPRGAGGSSCLRSVVINEVHK